MAKHLNVNMSFTADTTQAKRQIQELQTSLHNLVGNTKLNLGIGKEMEEAVGAAAELSAHIQKATNAKTGTLDFSKLNQSIKASGKSLSAYGQSLLQLGPVGRHAFMELASAVQQSEIPLKRVNARVQEFATTLANTARWQLSSSVLHGFMGALQSAYGYAQDLNESLNNIQIVTGANIDKMSEFAVEANKAAKALSTTTTEYTKASLIYYQQGLSDSQVKERTDVTVKLANVSRQSAETVSDQMTAIWNNFYDGSESLEHYADVLTALGAATASSTEEIAGGLEKFAAIADTIGLSYEYAAAALATLTSNTRQSEEVVGTALKTIFARIQGLNLGETLDDGTTLNKYSQALATVGINIKDINGNLKDMDMILDEMGTKWNTLSRDQQAALAQTVAGTRQYNQLMALMANWNNGDNDSFKANLQTATGADGTLQDQADIYAESWEAAADRVTAAAEEIYSQLINDDFFIDLLNNIEKLLGVISSMIDGLGGMRGVLLTVSTLMTKVFSDKIAHSVTDMAYNLKMMTKDGRRQVEKEKDAFIEKAIEDIPKSTEYTTESEKAQQDSMRSQLQLQKLMIANGEKMSEVEKATNQQLLDRNRLLHEEVELMAKKKEETSGKVDEAKYELQGRIFTEQSDDIASSSALIKELNDEVQKIRNTAEVSSSVTELTTNFNNAISNIPESEVDAITEQINKLKTSIGALGKEDDVELKKLVKQFSELDLTTGNVGEEIDILMGKLKSFNMVSAQNIKENIIAHTAEDAPQVTAEINALVDSIEKDAAANVKLASAREASTKAMDKAKTSITSSTGAQKKWADTLVESVNSALSFVTALQMIGSLWDTIQDPDTSGWEKFVSVLTTLSVLIPTLMTSFIAFSKILKSETAAKLLNIITTKALAKEEKKLADTKKESSEATAENTENINEETASETISFVGKHGRQRTFSGKYNNHGEPLDDNGQKIADKFVQRYKLKEKIPQKPKTPEAPKAPKVPKNTPTTPQASAAPKTSTAPSGAAEGVKGLKGALGTKIGGSSLSVGGLLGGLAVAAVLIAGAIAAFKALDKIYRKNEIAAQKAEEAAVKLKARYGELKTEYEGLLSTIDNYDNARNSLDGLVEGTTEFSEAVMNANEEALKLLDTYGELISADQVQVDANGLITIDDAALAQIKEAQLQKVQWAQGASILANQQAREARITANMTELNRKEIKSKEGFTSDDMNNTGKASAAGLGAGAAAGLGVGIGAAAAGATIGGAAGSVVPVVGTLIGAAAGLIIGGVAGAIANGVAKNSETDEEKEVLKKLGERYASVGAGALTDESIRELTNGNESLAQELINNKDEVKKLCKEMAANTLATNAENKAMAANIIKSSSYAGSRYADEMSFMGGRALSQAQEAEYEKIMSETKSKADLKALANQYFASQDIDDKAGFEVKKYNANKDIVTYSYLDENGERQEKEITTAEMASMVASIKAQDAVTKSCEVLAKTFMQLDKASDDLSNGMSEFLTTGNISELTKAEYDALAAKAQSGDGAMADYLAGLGLDNSAVQALGYSDVQELISSMNLKAAGDSWSKYSDITSLAGASGNLTLKQAQNISEATGELGNFYGTDMAAEMKGLFDGMASALSTPEAQEQFWSQLGNITDYTDAEAWDNFVISMQEATDLTEVEAEALKLFAENASLAANATKQLNFEDLKTNVKGLQSIMKSMTSGKRDISDDDMAMLKSKGIDTSKFAKTLDGWRYLGDTGEMVATISEGMRSEFKDVEQNFVNIAEEAEQAKKNVEKAEAALAEAKIAADEDRANQLAAAKESVTAFEIIGEMMRHVVDVVANGIKAAWDWICNVCLDIYDFFVKIFNTIGEGISNAWNTFIGFLENLINGISKAIKTILSAIGVDTDGWAEVHLQRTGFTPAKTSAEIQAEAQKAKELKEAEEALIQSIQKIVDATPTLVDSIQASADYLTEEELAAKKSEMESNKESAQSGYDAAVAKYGKNSNQADYYKALVDSYDAQIEAYENAILSRQALIKDIKKNERYDDVNKTISVLNNELDKTSKLKDAAFGEERLQYIATEIGLTKQLIAQEKAYQAEINEDLKDQQTNMATKWGAEFDERGNISNYDDLLNKHAGSWEEVKADLEQYEATQNNLIESDGRLIDLNNQIGALLTETYDAADEAISSYSEKLEHHNKLLEHQKQLMSLIGKSSDYKALGIILEGQAKLAENNLQVSKKQLEFYENEVEALNAKMDEAANNPELFAQYSKQLKDIETKARNAEDQMLSDLQAWAEAEKSVLENTLEDLGKTLEESLTGGMSFDELSTSMERAQSLQEEYLTTTNQIYETTKMMRTAQQAIDTSTNSIAKEKLKNFIAETKQLQEQSKLSQYELDMQQAKYDLLVAEIALEEAQNAKSTVRLQRDSEGNFGYVYTADAGAISEAQQQFDDAQNALYNKGLDGANDYTQKYQQTMSEMTNTLQEIQTNYLNGSYANEEEYQNAMLEAKSYYFEKLQGYSQLYGVALAADSNIAAEAWSTDFADMVTSTEKWNDAVDEYMGKATDAFEKWEGVVTRIEEQTGEDLTALENKVKSITDANDALTATLSGDNGIINGMAEQLKSAGDIAKAYQDQATNLGDVLTKINQIKSAVGIQISPITSDVVEEGAATGGLTANWGPEGKMLMVHESELILNKDQTNKFFENLAIMESILATIDSYVLGQQLGGIISSPGYAGGDSGTLEQNVRIEASFPSVTDRSEIEEAFNNLVNKASQYANRK